MNQGAKIVSESIIGSDFRTVFVDGKAYTVYPPTVHKLAGAISNLSDIQEADNLKEVLLSLGESEAEVVVNDTLLGQIASFMENLHLLYREVAYEIPYRNLVLMQRDKLHTVTGTKVIKGKDMASHRRRNKKQIRLYQNVKKQQKRYFFTLQSLLDSNENVTFALSIKSSLIYEVFRVLQID